MKRHAPALLALLAAAVVLTWPLVPELGRAVPGHPSSDSYDHLWGYWWYGWSLAHGELPLRTSISHWPPGGLLYFVDPYGAILSLPLQLLFGIGIAYSLTILLTVWSGMATMYAVAWAELRQQGPAMLAGVIFGGSAFVVGVLHSGTMEYAHVAPLPVVWYTMRRALDDGSRRHTILAALAWTWATFAAFYYGAFAGFIALAACWDRREHGWQVVGERLAAVIIVFAVFVAPIFGVAGWTLTSPDAAVSSENAPGWNYKSLPATDLLTFLHPGDYVFPDNRDTGNYGIRHVNYLGFVPVIAGIVGLWRHKALRWPFAVLMLLALGPTLAFDRDLVFAGGRPVPLPATLLYFPGSPFRFVHHPFRMVVLPTLFLALAAAHALRGRGWLAMAVAALCVVETVSISPAIWPIPTAEWAAPKEIVALAEKKSIRGIFDWPPHHHVQNRRYEMLQTFHHKVVPYGTNSFLPEDMKDNHFVRSLMGCMKKPAVAVIPREGGAPEPGWLERAVASRVPEGRQRLVDAGYDLMILHTDALAHGELSCTRERIGTDALFEGKEVEAYPIVQADQ